MVGINNIQVGSSWIDPMVSFLKDGTLLEDRIEVEKIQRKAP